MVHYAVMPAIGLCYFLVSIGVVGGAFAYAAALPLWTLGRFWRPAWLAGGRTLRRGVQVLLAIQPWLVDKREISLPSRCVTVSNHRSHLDMFLLLASIPSIRALAKSELFKVPGLGLIMRATRQIPVKRGDSESYWKAMDEAYDALLDGDPVHFFPEMTRCEPGFRGTREFHLAPFRVAVRAGVPVVPIAFVGTDEAWPKGLFGVRRKKVRVQSLEPVLPDAFPTAEAMRGEARRRIDAYLREAYA